MLSKRIFLVGTGLLSIALDAAAAEVTLKAGSAAAYVFKPARAAANLDTTPPNNVSGSPTVSCVAATTATLSATIDEAGTGYYQLSTSATAPTVTDLMQSGTQLAMTANTASTKSLTGLTASTNYYLHFVAKDTSNNAQAAVSTVAFRTTAASPLVFASVSADEGYVKATAAGGSAVASNGAIQYMGRGSDGLFNRAVLSFDTTGIPTCATITQAYVTVTYSTMFGDPWANPAGNTLVVDMKTGAFGADGIETGDWLEAPTASAVATIDKFTFGTKASAPFSAAGISALNKTGKTQIKLRFSSDQSSTNYIGISKGASTLTVVYTP
ncbi:MAG: hypothetical protein HYS18_14675 [Burkholderiales bacterium]|nr:hypothetical protein [Burkholderiales bacterium]